MSACLAKANERQGFVRVAIALMSVAAVVWLSYQFWRLLFHQGETGAIDLKQRYLEVATWFQGQPVYGAIPPAAYPPATLTLLWPFLGWLSFSATRWLWAATTLLQLAWLSRLSIRGSAADTRVERAFVGLLPVSAYATGAAIGNGQLIVHLLPCLLAGLLLMRGERVSLFRDLIGSCLFLFALTKPSVAAPFFWLVVFAPRLRPSLLVLTGYLACTLIAASFQQQGVIDLLGTWAKNAERVLQGPAVPYSNGNLHALLAGLGQLAWLPALSSGMLLVTGLFIYRYRHVDFWVCISVCALVSRLHTYHGWYDDLLVLLPMVTLFRLLKGGQLSPRRQSVAIALFIASLVLATAPGGLYLLPSPFDRLIVAAQTTVWLMLLGFLVHLAFDEPRPGRASVASRKARPAAES